MVEASQGQIAKITTNFFNLRRSPVNNITIYSLNFSPDIEAENRNLRFKLLNKGKAEVESRIGEYIKSGNVLYSRTLVREPFSVPVQSHDNAEYNMIITPVGTITGENVDSYRMYANSVLKKMLYKLDLKQVTKLPKFYDISRTQRIEQHNLDVFRGYTATFSHHLRDMLLNLDFSSKIIRNTTLLQYIQEIQNQAPRNVKLEDFINNKISGIIVMARYGNFKCYKLDRILLDERPTNSFTSQGKQISFTEYYRSRYNITIGDLRQPLLLTKLEKGMDKAPKLIPELCVLTGIPDEMRMDFRAMNDIAEYTRLHPSDRLSTSIDFSRRLSEDPSCRSISDAFCMEINPNPIVVDGIILPAEKVKCGPSESDTINIDAKGNFMIKSRLMDSKPIDNWIIMTTERDARSREIIIKTLMSKAKQIRLELGQPVQMDYHPNNLKNIVQRLHIPQKGMPVPQLALIVIGPNDKRGYNDIKEACALTSGIPTQCLKANNVNNPKKFDSIMSKILIQMAVKTGSAAWQMSKNPSGIPTKTMVVGIDVFHDTVLRAKSVLGFVASIHPQFHNYYNTTRIHSKVGEEIGGHVGDCLREALLAFNAATKGRFLPECIIVYRDGVSDSQIEAARRFEVEAMKRAIGTFEGYNPNLVYVLVNKKTNCKLYSRSGKGIQNPQPGTFVNSVIVPDGQSFYLVAHAVTQGMASPTLYRIISNEGAVDHMSIAKLAFKLCHLYYNWTGAIKVPGPTMMAHKLAYLVGQSVHATHVEPLRTLPWFY